MNKMTVLSIIFVAAGALLLINASRDMSTYSTFTDAIEGQKVVKIVGHLSKDKEMTYNPEIDPNYFSFYMTDDEGREQKVVLLAEKPQDFERSEQIVITGQMKGDEFHATDMLLKCPSKYKDEEIRIRSKAT